MSTTIDKPTFERIVADHRPFVRRTLSHLGVLARHLADVEQEVFRGVYRGLSRFDPSLAPHSQNAVKSWLFGICERQAACHRRQEMRRAEVLLANEDLDGGPSGAADTEDSVLEAERKTLLFELLATLEPRRRAVIIAYELEGTPMAEVAEKLKVPVNTCWNRLRLARADLRAAWTRKAAACRAERSAALPPLVVIFGGSAFGGVEPAPLGAREWLFCHLREWLSAGFREDLFHDVRAWLSGLVRRTSLQLKLGVMLPAVGVPVLLALLLRPSGVPESAALPRDEDFGLSLASVPPPVVDREVSPFPSPSVQPRLAQVSTGAPHVETADIALEAEVTSIKSIMEAMRTGDVASAVSALAEYDAAFPRGRMQGDAFLLRLRILQVQGRPQEARDRARQFLVAYPNSSYRVAIESVAGKVD